MRIHAGTRDRTSGIEEHWTRRRRVTARLTLSMVAVFAAAVLPRLLRPMPQQPIALTPLVINAFEWLWPADGVRGGDGLCRPGRAQRHLAGQGRSRWRSTKGNTPPLAAESRSDGIGTAGSALLAWFVRRRSRGSKDGVPDHRPARASRSARWTTTQPVAEHRRRLRLDRVDLLEQRHRSRCIRPALRSTQPPPAR